MPEGASVIMVRTPELGNNIFFDPKPTFSVELTILRDGRDHLGRGHQVTQAPDHLLGLVLGVAEDGPLELASQTTRPQQSSEEAARRDRVGLAAHRVPGEGGGDAGLAVRDHGSEIYHARVTLCT